ncbi:MAG: hypothetical protein QXN59_00865, partial [Candidatus Micrarchaeaceae archaeon]
SLRLLEWKLRRLAHESGALMAKGMHRDKRKRQQEKKGIVVWPLYIAFAILLVLYIRFGEYGYISIALGGAAFAILVVIIGIELVSGINRSNFVREGTEIAVAIAIVIGLWIALRFILATPTPIDVVPSCSMLPTLNRGDMILVQGINVSKLRAPIVNVTKSEFAAMESNIGNEFNACVAYKNYSQGTVVSQIIKPGYEIGLLAIGSGPEHIISNASQSSNLVRYFCGERKVNYSDGVSYNEAYTTAIEIGNTIISGDRNNSIIVYRTVPQDSFYANGDTYVVHRVYAVLDAQGEYYILTKGDNNPGLDMQYGNIPINSSEVNGRVIVSVPFIGYIKLILSGDFRQPAGCNYTITH